MLGREPRLAEGVAGGGAELVDQAGERRERHDPEQRAGCIGGARQASGETASPSAKVTPAKPSRQ